MGIVIALIVALIGTGIVWVFEFLTFGDVRKDSIVLYTILFIVFFCMTAFIFA